MVERVREAGPHQRRCWDCGHVDSYMNAVAPECLCRKCGSQDTRRVKKLPAEAVASATTSVDPPAFTGIGVNDPVVIKIHVESCLTSLRDEDGRCQTFELATAATKLREAVMWIDEHLRLH